MTGTERLLLLSTRDISYSNLRDKCSQSRITSRLSTRQFERIECRIRARSARSLDRSASFALFWPQTGNPLPSVGDV